MPKVDFLLCNVAMLYKSYFMKNYDLLVKKSGLCYNQSYAIPYKFCEQEEVFFFVAIDALNRCEMTQIPYRSDRESYFQGSSTIGGK